MPKNVKSTTIGLQELLTDMYGEERRISALLRDFGLSDDNIDTLKTEKIADFYENLQFALKCRFLHYSSGHRLLLVLLRRYGLFDHPRETLESIGDSMKISRERVRQLESKAIKRLKGGVSADSVGILIALAACKTLCIDAMDLLRPDDDESSEDYESGVNLENSVESPDLPTDLPHADFYVQGSFDYVNKRGRYQLLMKFGNHSNYFKKNDLESKSDVTMILLAVIEGLEKLRKPCVVTVRSNTIFGISAIYRKGTLREIVPDKAANRELKEHIRQLLNEKGHVLRNVSESNVREKISKLRKVEPA